VSVIGSTSLAVLKTLCLSICLCVYVCLSVRLSACVYVSVSQVTEVSDRLQLDVTDSVSQWVDVTGCGQGNVSVCLSVCLYVCLPVCVCLSACVSQVQ